MSSKPQATRTVNPIHFEDLEPHRFEDLVRQLAYDFRIWRTLEATGRLGSDEGIDIRGVEIVPHELGIVYSEEDENERLEDTSSPYEERVWTLQCKREKRIGPQAIRKIVREAVPEGTDPPYGLVIAASCDVTKRTMDAFREEARACNVQEFELWSKARIEDLLFQPRHDHLLFAYFGLSLSLRHRSQLTSLRRYLAIKRKLYRTLTSDREDRESLRRLIHSTLLIRDVDEQNYPDEQAVPDFGSRTIPPWHIVLAQGFHVHSISVSRVEYVGWIKDDGSWDMAENGPNVLFPRLNEHLPLKYQKENMTYTSDEIAQWEEQVPEQERAWIETWLLLPYENVLEIDADGDPVNNIPQLFCIFKGEHGPYDSQKTLYVASDPKNPYSELRSLEPEKRTTLFRG